jgi:hypothetical protein
MLRTSLTIAALSLALSACGDASKGDGSPAASTEEALRIAATPFSIGDSTENEMGAAPRNEFSDGGTDPYERMAHGANVAPPAKAEMAQ